MWLRTTMNYQYRYGTGTREAMSTLYKQGGIGRFYQGLPYALMQAPLTPTPNPSSSPPPSPSPTPTPPPTPPPTHTRSPALALIRRTYRAHAGAPRALRRHSGQH